MPANNKARWRNRVLILSLVGIAALTLFPYRFSYALSHHPQPSFLLLRLPPKHASLTDFILNVLLFVPLGFAVALRCRSRDASDTSIGKRGRPASKFLAA